MLLSHSISSLILFWSFGHRFSLTLFVGLLFRAVRICRLLLYQCPNLFIVFQLLPMYFSLYTAHFHFLRDILCFIIYFIYSVNVVYSALQFDYILHIFLLFQLPPIISLCSSCISVIIFVLLFSILYHFNIPTIYYYYNVTWYFTHKQLLIYIAILKFDQKVFGFQSKKGFFYVRPHQIQK